MANYKCNKCGFSCRKKHYYNNHLNKVHNMDVFNEFKKNKLNVIEYDDLKNIIGGKSVAIVGPAGYVTTELDDTHGNYIDSFDVVIRLNSMVKLPDKKMEKYYGSKCDLLSSHFHAGIDDPTLESCNENMGRYLFMKNYEGIPQDMIIFESKYTVEFKKVFYKNPSFFVNKGVKYCNMPKNQYNKYVEKYDLPHGTTGILTLISIIDMEPRALYVTGMTCYIDCNKGLHEGYYDGYMEMDSSSFKLLNDNYTTAHNLSAEQHIFRNFISDNIINVDKYLYSLFFPSLEADVK